MSDHWLTPLDANVEDETVEEVMNIISAHAEKGFDEQRAKDLTAEIKAMKHEDTKGWEFEIVYLDKPRQVRVRVFKDDLSGADLGINTTDPALAKKLSEVSLDYGG